MNNNTITTWGLLIVGGFAIGGIMFSYILPRLIMKKDICALSNDNNPGAANVFKNCGVPMGLCCLMLDMAKGFLPVYLATRLANYNNLLFAPVMIAPVLGHAIAPFNRFHGGKCIATIFGEMLALFRIAPVGFIALALLYILFSTLFRISPHSKRSIVTFLLFGNISFIILVLSKKYSIAVGCLAVSFIAIRKHGGAAEIFPVWKEQRAEDKWAL
ncbi:MAG: glycerol-3-phosphate acyltransferase [Faecousia sp.]